MCISAAAPWNIAHFAIIHKMFPLLFIESTSSNLGKAFEDLKKDWPDSLEKFKPASEDECSEHSHGMYCA
jgi:hypothetical protein